MKFYLRNPDIVIIGEKIWHSSDNYEMEISKRDLELLDFLAIKRSMEIIIDNFQEEFSREEILSYTKKNWIIEVEENDIHISNKRGLFGSSIEKFPFAINQKPNYIILGMPYDLGVSNKPGTRFAPDIIRQFSNSIMDISEIKDKGIWDPNTKKFELKDIEMIDIGNIKGDVLEQNGIHNVQLEYLTQKILEANIKPIILGGDHSISYSTINAACKEYTDIGVIHFDAHSDFGGNNYSNDLKGMHHGNFWDYLVDKSQIREVVQIGCRQLEYSEIKHHKIQTISANEVVNNLFDLNLDEKLPYYITFDIDVLDPSIISSTGTPVPGGLSFNDLMEIFNVLFKNKKIIGIDFVEYSPNNIVYEHIMCSQIIYELLRRIKYD